MMGPEEQDTLDEYERAISEVEDGFYELTLFVTGSTPRSTRAIQNIKNICEKHLHGRYTLEVVDIYQQPDKARDDQILAAPTLIKKLPLPLRRLIGDLSSEERVLVGLNLVKRDEKGEV
jgi:circadian clock protein KaiB